jgi:hypothetical protein
MPKTNRWHPCLLPDNYLRKMKQDLADADKFADSATHLEPDPEFIAEPQNDNPTP